MLGWLLGFLKGEYGASLMPGLSRIRKAVETRYPLPYTLHGLGGGQDSAVPISRPTAFSPSARLACCAAWTRTPIKKGGPSQARLFRFRRRTGSGCHSDTPS